MSVPADYEQRVYAGVLGKLIGVYLGRPFEGWTYERIQAELGDVTYYVNDRDDVALKHHLLVVADDDISGTLVFARVLRDHGLDPTPAQVGATWLNEIVPGVSILWWGGLGNSTEHTAYLRMRAGETPPATGSIARNGRVVAEQVGAQIFVEGLAMTCPGDPERAADLAESAASVSHDGEALLAARVVAALVAGSFGTNSMADLLDRALSLVPTDSLIAHVHHDVRSWAERGDWKETRARIAERYGYDRYAGNCHVVPNHAIVVAALAHSGGDFDEAMKIVCTSGWDTDSNGGNVGAICGVHGGLEGLSAQDWRGPLADRLYLPAADGGGCLTDAATEAYALAEHGRRRYGEQPRTPAARFSFDLPGAIQGFDVVQGRARLDNPGGCLRVRVEGDEAVVTTPTFIPPEGLQMPIYALEASPSLYPGQTVEAQVDGDAQLVLAVYDAADELRLVDGPAPAHDGAVRWRVPDVGGQPIAAIGIRVAGEAALRDLTWTGAPEVDLTRPADGGTLWRRAWVNAVDRFDARWPEPYRIVHNTGAGRLVTGTREWRDYEVEADVTPHLVAAAGIGARIQGMTGGYVLELVHPGRVRLLAGDRILLEKALAWKLGETHQLRLVVEGDRLSGYVDGQLVADVHDTAFDRGGVALTVAEGRTATQHVRISPITQQTGPAGRTMEVSS